MLLQTGESEGEQEWKDQKQRWPNHLRAMMTGFLAVELKLIHLQQWEMMCWARCRVGTPSNWGKEEEVEGANAVSYAFSRSKKTVNTDSRRINADVIWVSKWARGSAVLRPRRNLSWFGELRLCYSKAYISRMLTILSSSLHKQIEESVRLSICYWIFIRGRTVKMMEGVVTYDNINPLGLRGFYGMNRIAQ